MPPAFNLSQDQTLQLNLASPKALSFELKCLSQAFIADSWLTLTDGPINPPAGVRTNFLRTLSKILFPSLPAVRASRPREPTILQQISFPSTPQPKLFSADFRTAAPAVSSVGAAQYRRVSGFVKRVSAGSSSIPASARSFLQAIRPHRCHRGGPARCAAYLHVLAGPGVASAVATIDTTAPMQRIKAGALCAAALLMTRLWSGRGRWQE
jgi:hypothetical protein